MRGNASGAKFGFLFLFFFVFFAGPAFPDTVKYIYDSLGRLAMTISSNGTMVVYGYDQAGRLTSTTRMAGSQQPSGGTTPLLAGITPANVFVGGETSFTITGSNLLTTISVTTSNPGIKVVNFSASDNSVTIDAQIQKNAATGPSTFTVTTLSGSESISMDLLNLTFSPSQVVLVPGASETVTGWIGGLTSNYNLTLTNQVPALISVPQSVTVPASGSATFTINALAIGTSVITAGNSALSVFVSNPFAGSGTASSKPVSVFPTGFSGNASVVSKPVRVFAIDPLQNATIVSRPVRVSSFDGLLSGGALVSPLVSVKIGD